MVGKIGRVVLCYLWLWMLGEQTIVAGRRERRGYMKSTPSGRSCTVARAH